MSRKSRGGQAFTRVGSGGSRPGRIYKPKPCGKCGRPIGANTLSQHEKRCDGTRRTVRVRLVDQLGAAIGEAEVLEGDTWCFDADTQRYYDLDLRTPRRYVERPPG